LKYASKIVLFKNDETFSHRFVMFEFSNKYGISTSEDCQTLETVLLHFSIEIFAMGDVEECGTVEEIGVPV
jgi:hypothetical protein